jgi:integrase
VASLEDRGADSTRLRWRVRWRDPQGHHRSRSFARKADAERYLAGITTSIYAGTYVDPAAGRATVADVALPYLERISKTRKRTTSASYAGLWRTLLEPRWARVPVASISHTDVAGWVADLSSRYSPSRTRQAHGLLSSILDDAVADRRIPANPARGVELPRMPRRRAYPVLGHGEVAALADAAGEIGGPLDRALVLLLAYTGLRWGEAAGLRWVDVDLLRRRIRVEETIVEVDGRQYPDTPKSHQARIVPLAAPAALALETLPRTTPRVFTGSTGLPLRTSGWTRRILAPACERAGLPRTTPHGLRHTAATLAVESGAPVKAVQTMLGHALGSYTMTLDVYADAREESLDEVAARMTEAAERAPKWEPPRRLDAV